MSITLLGGGARSGKSRYALDLARKCGGRLAFVAAARAEDDEMRRRIALHKYERGPQIETFVTLLQGAPFFIRLLRTRWKGGAL